MSLINKNKIYIGGAVTGVKGYVDNFAAAENFLRDCGYNYIINPVKILAGMPESTTHEEYMKISLLLLDMCDSIFLLNGWEKSCGASMEYGYALAKGKKIIQE